MDEYLHIQNVSFLFSTRATDNNHQTSHLYHQYATTICPINASSKIINLEQELTEKCNMMNKSKTATLINPPLAWLTSIVPHPQQITTATALGICTNDANHMVSTYIYLIPDKSNTTNNCKYMIRIGNEQMNLKSNSNNNNGFILDESNSTTIHAQEIIVWGQF